MLQIIAMITMLIDHVGLIFFPNTDLFRIIGRIAFPLYSWFLVQGYLYTRELQKYMWRLFGLACLSQIPYTLALQQWEFNVIFTLLLALFALHTIDHVPDGTTKSLIILGIFCAAVFIPMDYGLYGIILILLLRYFTREKLVGYHLILNLLYFFTYGIGFWIQLFSIVGTILIAYLPGQRPITRNRWLWLYRTFYPAHLTVLFFLYLWIQHLTSR